MDARQLARLMLDCLIVDNVRIDAHRLHTKPGPLLALAQHYGIDAKAVMADDDTPAQTPARGAKTPSTAARAQGEAGAAGAKKAPAAKGKAKAPAVKYTHPATGETWSGRGLQPAWVKAWLANGRSLAQLEKPADAGDVKDDAGSAGGRAASTAELFEEAV